MKPYKYKSGEYEVEGWLNEHTERATGLWIIDVFKEDVARVQWGEPTLPIGINLIYFLWDDRQTG